MRTFTLTAAVLALLVVPAFAKPPVDGIHWAKSWDEAIKEAKERNVPILVTFHKDNCPRCTGMDSSVFNQKDFIAASRRWVCVYCNKDTGHGTVKVDGKDMCKICPSITCEEHVKCDQDSGSGKYFNGTIGTPATVWADQTGKKIGDNQGGMSSKQLLEKLAEAEKQVGPGLDEDAYSMLQDKLAAGEKAAADGNVKDAVEAYASAVKSMAKNAAAKTWVDKAQAALDKLAEAAKKKIEEATAAKDAGDFAKARELLKAVLADFKGQPVAKEAEKAMADVAAAEKAKK
jgi:thioredoxin-related protein